jgi:type III pantothenate kinase
VRLLLVDVGNTRIKWARLDGQRMGRSRARAHAGWTVDDYRRHLFSGPAAQGALIASVAGRGVDAALAAAARRSGARTLFIRVPRRGAGVSVGYREPWRLGIDRFVAAVGAHRLFPGIALLVVGVGTATTLDLIDRAGRHRGGAIVPSPALMVQTLLAQTHGIRRRARGGPTRGAGVFARSTRSGIEQGARFATAGLIDRSAEEARLLLGRRPLLVLTGGQSGAVRPLLLSNAVTVPDLVLRGLAVLAAAPATSARALN